MLALVRRSGIPEPAALLGAAGLLPFVAGAAASLAGPALAGWARPVLLAYAALILSFLGGVHWGLAMRADRPSHLRYAMSTVPSLLGWLALVLGGRLALLLLVASFASLLAYDRAAVRGGEAPGWYARLRSPLTLIVIACLLVAAVPD